ncbi:hydroxyethylthiazole kinase [Chryseobacterium sp. Ch-15]|uniref:Hydroxyethylthiazole kinase n=1 Tax=Chryseobacterium muglaense TaxID=2893752 RepID=A0A9Q3UZT2_9FLAO|nr:hydroxyethylthiazole kinase [Chryseobacterium muglaense]MBD3907214.1 hydroxyethylthiazole kinase [Chryseobacterium muglaense]MCC9036630.1 hydroxyethylthiazole kinase [Chryseobacterium muglaense]MCM2556909.1 hydroxyethylthiazole kinase [Chryseobacterium muglaense]
MENNLWNNIIQIRNTSPLVHSITNYVVMNNTANAVLAIGASPIMAHAKSEVEEMVNISHSLVINIGTIDEYWEEAMLLAAKKANELNKPWILDPVGAGATSYRDSVLSKILSLNPTVIRGNASEIIALSKFSNTITKGVDSTAKSNEALETAKTLAQHHKSIVCISGETDIIINENQEIHLKNGHPMMTKVTGLGCTATALIGSFIGIIENKTEAVVSAMSLLGIAGEIAAQQSAGPGSLQLNIIDKLYNITEDEFSTHLKMIKQ